MSRARLRTLARLSVPWAAALCLASGCASLLGMESATCSDCEPTTATAELAPASDTPEDEAQGSAAPSADAPGAGTPPPADPCAAYCDQLMATCSDPALVPARPYLNRAACLAVCGHIPAGSAGDTSGNSLACRASLLASSEAQSEPGLVCQAAGRGGQAGRAAVCGSNCDAYCSFIDSICPDRLPALDGDCAAACAALPDLLTFDAALDRAGNSVQCRLWHVGVAAECTTEECRERHCGHAVGIEDCLPEP